ncbi:hypothetical protein KC878_01040 [Candidatus Saccharibacteria bacterium]|nr:hypothetical protein [Candidatus Saccharibacteria bacterium]MCB9821149.1 hypothetical protein [Candidatus Nomurabacteria bacterium]
MHFAGVLRVGFCQPVAEQKLQELARPSCQQLLGAVTIQAGHVVTKGILVNQ